jgi:hypothetical protein
LVGVDLKMSKTNQAKRVESQVSSHGENPTLQITTVKLDGLNLDWSQSALLFIKSKGKMENLNGRIQEPKLIINGKQKILPSCQGCCIHCNRKSARSTCFFVRQKRFGIQLLRRILKWGMLH